MLGHVTNNALATLMMIDKHSSTCWYDNYLYMTIVLARSLREIGYTQDIVVITNHEPYKEMLEKEGLIIKWMEMFDYPALYDFKCKAWGLSRYDMQKIHYWSLSEYSRVICLDCDILATKKFMDWDKIGNLFQWGGRNSPVNSGMMGITPSEETYTDMRQILKTAKFSPESGWNECGLVGGVEDWEFQAANAAQGFIPYYFGDETTLFRWGKYFRHYAGSRKYKKEYMTKIKENGFKLALPEWAKRPGFWAE